MSWCGNFVKRGSFRIVSGNLPMWNLCLSTKFSLQEIRWNYGILRSAHLCLEAAFQALKLAQNCYLHYHISIFFLKTGNLIINWLLLFYATERICSPFDKIWRQRDFKNLNSVNRLFSELGKNWKCILGYINIPVF